MQPSFLTQTENRANRTVCPKKSSFLFRKLTGEFVFSRIGWNRGRIDPVETGRAVCVRTDELTERFDGKIRERIDADDLCDFLHAVTVCDEIFFRIDVRSVITGVQERGRRDAHMDLLCARFAQKLYDASARRTAHDRIVDEDDAFPL